MKSNVLEVIDECRCCGCMSCKASCPNGSITVENDEFGFYYPSIDEHKCIRCGKCVQACPVLNNCCYNKPINAYAAVNKNDDKVLRSSSGGLFSGLAEVVLSEGGVVCGAAMDEEFEVSHIIIASIDELHLLRKSKYVQSYVGNIYLPIKEYLKTKKVLFSGTPCQVAALNAFLGKQYDNLISIDVVCHGVPSNTLFQDYIRHLKEKLGDIEYYEFRAKKNPKNGMNWFSAVKQKKHSRKVFNWPTDSYNYYYMKGKIYRYSCYDCQFAIKERASDITLCDYWGWEQFHQDQFPRGTSLSGVIINSEKGQILYNQITNKINSVHTEYDNIVINNKSIISSASKPDDRNEILNLWINEGYDAIDKKFKNEKRTLIWKYKMIDLIPDNILRFIKKLK